MVDILVNKISLEIKSEDLIDKIKKAVHSYNTNSVLIHSDLYVSSKLLLGNKNYRRTEFLEAHSEIIKNIFSDFDIWMPAFNYDFFATGIFDARNDKVQLGPFPEYFRTNVSEWRTPIPVLSFSGTGEEPNVNFSNEIDLYDGQSAYSEFLKRNGIIFYYGTNLQSTTFIHFIESVVGKPVYRYDKTFFGKVIDKNGNISEHKIISHVRPSGKPFLQYNIQELQRELIDENIMKAIKINEGEFFVIACNELLEFWKIKIQQDPFYLLHKSSREWVEPIAEKLGRRFRIEDFEDI